MDDIALHRLHSQHLLGPRMERPEEVVSWFGAVQSQDFAAAKWALAQRLENTTEIEIDKAFADGAILRTHVLRPTWHFVSPLDIRWMLALTAPRVRAAIESSPLKVNLDEATISRSLTLLAQALEGGNQLTRSELRSVLEQAGIPAIDQRFIYILIRAELDGIVCSGAKRGKQFTYALLAERAPQARTLEREAALAELIGRYFNSHGPATLQDFAWWSGLTIADARLGLEAMPSPLLKKIVAGKTYWFGETPPITTERLLAVHLLPSYDEYTVGYTDRSALLDGRRTETLDPRSSVLLGNIILVNGKAVGAWKRTFKKGSVAISLTPFIPLESTEEAAVARAAQRYANFLSLPLVLD